MYDQKVSGTLTCRGCDFFAWRIVLLRCLDYLCAAYPGEWDMRELYLLGLTPRQAVEQLRGDVDDAS